MNIFRDRHFTPVVLGHLATDMLNGQRLVLLTYLSLMLGLNNTTLGLLSTIYLLPGALAQPLFGYLADRWGPRWLITGGLLWMGTFVSLAAINQGMESLVFLVISSLGSGVFHPAGAMQATLRGQKYLSGRAGTATAVFFLFGQMGYFLGPIISGRLLDSLGLPGLIILAGVCVPVALLNAWGLRDTGPNIVEAKHPVGYQRPSRAGWLVVVVLLALFAQAMVQGTMNTFLPRYLADLGQSASMYGFISALFMGGAAVGNLIGGNLSDRMSKYLVILIGLAGTSLPIYLIGRTSDIAWFYFLIPLAGILTGMAYTVLIILGQWVIPGGMGLASGLVLTLSFSAGAVGPLIAGFVADLSGLPAVFTLTTGVALIGALAAVGIGKQGSIRRVPADDLARAGD